MNYVGISCGFHDAALSVIDDNGDILFAGHSERYSKKKHDENLCGSLVGDANRYITSEYEIHYYERPYVKAVRQVLAGQTPGPFDVKNIIGDSYKYLTRRKGKIKTHNHHLCHAAAGFQTSPFEDATVVVIDAIGELDTISIWSAKYDKKGRAKYKKLWGRKYPDSIGLFYSAMTARVGLRPLDEEYILMGMAAYGQPKYAFNMERLFISLEDIVLEDNLHIGVDESFLYGADEMDIASSAQAVAEELIQIVMKKAKELGKSDNLVYGGGVALNCLANRLIGQYYKNIWIMPNPGDAGNSLGAAALGYGKKVNWKNAF